MIATRIFASPLVGIKPQALAQGKGGQHMQAVRRGSYTNQQLALVGLWNIRT
jgi:hypothetical protein